MTDEVDNELVTGYMGIKYTGDDDDPYEISFDIVLSGKSVAFWCDSRMLKILMKESGVIDPNEQK